MGLRMCPPSPSPTPTPTCPPSHPNASPSTSTIPPPPPLPPSAPPTPAQQRPPHPATAFPKDPFWQDILDYLLHLGILFIDHRAPPHGKYYYIRRHTTGTDPDIPPAEPFVVEISKAHVKSLVSVIQSVLETDATTSWAEVREWQTVYVRLAVDVFMRKVGDVGGWGRAGEEGRGGGGSDSEGGWEGESDGDDEDYEVWEEVEEVERA